jgi:hypothetical protein
MWPKFRSDTASFMGGTEENHENTRSKWLVSLLTPAVPAALLVTNELTYSALQHTDIYTNLLS